MNHPESSQAAAATMASVLRVRDETIPPGSSAQAGLAALPREVWQLVLEHLTYSSVESCAAASKATRSALCEALPLVTSIYVDQPAQLCQQGRLVKLLRGVRDINICAFSNERQPDDKLAADLVLPFIRNFPALESLSFGHIYSTGVMAGFRGLFLDATVVRDGRLSLGIFIGHRSLDSGESKCIRSLLGALGSAFGLDALPRSLTVSGLYCPRRWVNGWRINPGCDTCRRVFAYFPLQLALGFRHCLSRDEAIRIVEARPGGMEYLRSEARLLQLLGSGVSRIEQLYSPPLERWEWEWFHIVRYEEEDLAEIETLARSDHIDVGKIDPRTANSALMRSFIRYFDRMAPLKATCYIDEVSFARLKATGLPIEEEDFLTPQVTRVEYLPIAIERMAGSDRVMQRISTIQVGSAILPSSEHSATVAHQLVDAGVLPIVTGLLQVDYPNLQGAAARICAYVATIGKGLAKAAVEAGVVPHLSHLLGSANFACYASATAIILMILESFPEERDTMLRIGVADPLVRLLKRPGVFENAFMARGVTALEHLCRADPLGFSAKLDPALKPILRILYQLLFSVDKYEPALIDTFRALRHLWSKHADRRLRHLICDRLLGLVGDTSKSVAVREGASSTIQTIVRKDPTQARFIINGVTVKALCEHVQQPRKRCLEGSRGFRLLATAPRLLKLLTDGDELSEQHACSIINVLVGEDPDRVKLLISANYTQPLLDIGPIGGGHDMKISFLLQPLCNMLGTDGSESSKALRTLALVLQNIRWNRTEAAHVLIDAGVCHYLVKLLTHESPEEQSLALITLFHTVRYCESRAVYLSHRVLRRLIDLMSDDEFCGALETESGGQMEVPGAVACVIQTAIQINGMQVLSNEANLIIGPLVRVLACRNASQWSDYFVISALRAYEKQCSDSDKIALAGNYLALNLDDVHRKWSGFAQRCPSHSYGPIEDVFASIDRIVQYSVKRYGVGALIDAGILEALRLLLPASDNSNGSAASQQIADYATWILDVNLCHAVWLHLGGEATVQARPHSALPRRRRRRQDWA